MKKIAKTTKNYIFEDKSLFGLDISNNVLRLMQLNTETKIPTVMGYGSVSFDAQAIVAGVIVKPELIAEATLRLFNEGLIGEIDTTRVAVSLPANRAFTCAVRIPHLNPKDIDEAVKTEAEQYLPMSIDSLYLDYTLLRREKEEVEYFVVAIPRKIVDSYLTLTNMLGLEAILLDTAIGASAKLFAKDTQSNVPTVLIDFGARSTDITVYSRGLVVTGTVVFGSDDITEIIAKTFNLSIQEAVALKRKDGLSHSQHQRHIINALDPSLKQLIKEIRRTIRYYEKRYPNEPPIGQVVTMGYGADIPGIAEYLTEQLRLPTRMFDPTVYMEFGQLPAPKENEHMSYVTAAGLAVANPAEVFA